MGRTVFLAVVAVTGALVAGCGGTAGAPGVPVAVRAPAPGPATVEPTDGRLGAATTVRPGSAPRELSPGGRLDVRERDDAPRRDGVGAGATCPNPGLAPAPATLGAVADATLCLLNGERADHGLAPLVPSARLARAATAYAQDLVNHSYFSHTGRDGSGVRERIERVGYIPADAGWSLGENLAWGTGALATPGSIMQAWMNSPGHRENILNAAYREIGIGIVTGNPSRADGAGATYATEFGAIEGAELRQRAKQPRKRSRRAARARQARKVQQARSAGTARRTGTVRRSTPIARISS